MTVRRAYGYDRRRRIIIRPGLLMAAAAVLVVAAIAALIVLLSRGNEDYYILKVGSLDEPEHFTAVCLRNETVAAAEEVGRIEYVAAEGESLPAGSSVMRVYKTGYSEKTLQELADVQQKILQYQIDNIIKDTIDNELAGYNAEIESVISSIAGIVRNESSENILTYEMRLKELMEKRRAHLRSTCQPDSELTKLYQQESALLDRINIVSEYMRTSSAGIVSFYFDGYELLLSPSSIQELSYRDLLGICEDKKPASIDEKTSYTQLYRLIDGGTWYLLVLSKGNSPEFASGQEVSFRLYGYEDYDVRGTVAGSRADENGDYVYWVKMSSDITPFLNVRTVQGEAYKVGQGFKVPVSSIERRMGYDYITAIMDGVPVEIQVEISARNDKYAIISEKGSNYLTSGMQIKQ